MRTCNTVGHRLPFQRRFWLQALEDRLAPATITVNSIADNTATDGVCTLREALTSANNNADFNSDVTAHRTGTYGTENITFLASFFSSPKQITLTSALPTITDDVSFTGTTAANVTVARQSVNNFNLFLCSVPGSGVVTFSDMTLTGGSTTGQGGAIFAGSENVTVTRCVITNNVSVAGGGIGVGAGSSATITINNSTISNNGAGRGGGIDFASTGTLVITASTISGNTATSLSGGGGVYCPTNTTTIRDSTISGNLATSGPSGGLAVHGTVTVQNSTIAFNDAKTVGGGINRVSGSVSVESTILAQNTSGTSGKDIQGSVTANFSLIGISDDGPVISGSNNKTGTKATPLDPLLAALGSYGGPTDTHRPLAGSPVIDAGSNPIGLAFDQRGRPRVFGASADIGAVEIGNETLTVDSIADESDGNYSTGDLSLREAVEQANSYTGAGDVIVFTQLFTVPRTINLTLGEMAISESVAIGWPAVGLRLDAKSNSRVFNVGSGAAGPVTVAFSSITFANGLAATGTEFDGGAVLIGDDSVSFTACTFENNHANSEGGAVGVLSTASDVSFTDCTFTGNSAAINAGALNLDSGAGADISGCTFANNAVTTGDGGAIYITSGTVTIDTTKFSGNAAPAASSDGGAVYVNGSATLTVSHCQIEGNSAGNRGGGIQFNNLGTLTLTGSCLSDNTANDGGGLNLTGTTATVRNDTFSGNSATTNGGGINLVSFNGTLTVQNSTITDNTAATGGGIDLASGSGTISLESTIASDNSATSGKNVFTTGTASAKNCAVTNKTGITNFSDLGGNITTATDLKLGPLANNGGFTRTHVLLDGSPCLNKGSNPAPAIPSDQRGSGFPRTHSGTTDIGAYEQPNTYVVSINVDEDDGNTAANDLSLREAIKLANNSVGTHERIEFGVVGHLFLTLGEIAITDSLFIQGNSQIAVHGTPGDRIFNINIAGGTQDIFIDSMVLRDANLTAAFADGGAILAQDEPLTITNTTFTSNTAAGDGGAIYIAANTAAPLSLVNCTFSANKTNGGRGGAVANFSTGDTTISDCVFNSNTAATLGGAVYIAPTRVGLTVERCTLDSNSADAGGGIYLDGLNFGGTGVFRLNILDSTLSANKATAGDGGGLFIGEIYIFDQPPLVRNSTFSGNTATDGGAIAFIDNGTLSIQNSTLTANTAAAKGGGLFSMFTNTVELESTIFSGNSAGTAADLYGDPSSSLHAKTSAIGAKVGFTFFDDGGNLPFGTDVKLSPLADNGGATKTHALLAGSPAIDTGSNPGVISTDQRGTGFLRVSGPAPDMGAYERATTIVSNTNDAGTGSLRQAVLNALAQGGTDSVTFDATVFATAKTIKLSSEIALNEAMTITGPAAGVTVSGQGASRAFNTSGAAANANISITGLTLTACKANAGGAIYVNDEALTLTDCKVTGNTASSSGGGIYVNYAAGSLTLIRCTVSNNVVTSGGFAGGGIGSYNISAVSISDTTISGNSAPKGGGLFFYNSGSLLLLNSTISGNSATTTEGGGLYFAGTVGASGFNLRNSTISDNSAATFGGGIVLKFFSGTLTVQNSTVTANSAGTQGGGIARVSGTGTISLSSTVLAGNTNANTPDLSFNAATNVGGGNNLVGVTGVGNFTLTGSSNQSGTKAAPLDPKLGPLANNGGPTLTHAPFPGSPCLDKGNNLAAFSTDQRGSGFARNANGPDIGAVEVQTRLVTTTADSGVGSLRQAVADANATGGPDIITFVPAVFSSSQTITLTTGELKVTGVTTITGPGAGLLTVNGNNAGRVFEYVDSLNLLALSLSDLTVANGKVTGADGGGLSLQGGTVTLTRVNVANCSADGGGGLQLSGAGTTAKFAMTDCIVSGNVSTNGPGGGVSAGPIVDLTVQGGTLSGNTANSGGGGLYFNAGPGTLLVDAATISGNQAGTGGGFQIFGPASSGTMTIRNSTISGNSGTQGTGGIQLVGFSGTLAVLSSTVTANAGNSTLSNNGGGIARATGTATITIESSIVSGNSHPVAPDIASSGTVNVNFSAIGSAAGYMPSQTSGNNLAFGADVKLGPLANNGGTTKTHALLWGSPAVGHGSNPAGLTTDQRGKSRSVGAIDIGAFELQPAAKVNGTVIGDGTAQRSMVTQLKVTFDSPLTFIGTPAAAFTLTRQSDGMAVTLAAIVDPTNTVVTLTFTGGAVNNKSLADGRYTLTALADQFGADGLDGDGNGTGGDNFVLVGTLGNKLFRLFGDADGNGIVDGIDFGAFRTAFNTINAAFDFDNSGTVDGTDFGQFRARFGVVI